MTCEGDNVRLDLSVVLRSLLQPYFNDVGFKFEMDDSAVRDAFHTAICGMTRTEPVNRDSAPLDIQALKNDIVRYIHSLDIRIELADKLSRDISAILDSVHP